MLLCIQVCGERVIVDACVFPFLIRVDCTLLDLILCFMMHSYMQIVML